MSHLFHCTVHEVHPLTNSILQVFLSPNSLVSYDAGQYLEIISADECYPYSIANAPLGSRKLELHIRHTKDNPYNSTLLEMIKKTGTVSIRAPLGTCSVKHLDKNKPLLLIAGGTGFSPIKAIIEQLLADSDTRPLHVFWSAKTHSDLYMGELVSRWAQHRQHFQYDSIVTNDLIPSMTNNILQEYSVETLKECQWVFAGAFEMIYQLRDFFISKGLSQGDMQSDAFAFE